jgi:hypothetical protein
MALLEKETHHPNLNHPEFSKQAMHQRGGTITIQIEQLTHMLSVKDVTLCPHQL